MSLALAMMALGLTASTNALPHSRDISKSAIEWSPCPSELLEEVNAPNSTKMDCATLPVPLDYTDSDSDKLDLSLFRVKATKEPCKGTVLFNPGGPGGPGGENLPSQGPILVEQFGGHYNVLSWDPRGTGKTLPFSCNITDETISTPQKRDENDSLIKVNSTQWYLNGGFEAQFKYVEKCYEENKEIGELLGSAFTARDVMEIVDALDEGGMLRYYGLSYGAVLGDYLAAMFPDRIESMILDSNPNPHEYRDGSYRGYLEDTDKTLIKFLDECLKNADRCALAQYTKANTTGDLMQALNAALLPLAENATKSEEAWTLFATSKTLGIHETLYFPNQWPKLAESLTSMLNGSAAEATDAEGASEGLSETPYNLGEDSINAIRCGDSTTRVSSPEEFLDTIAAQYSVSESFSDVGYQHTWVCSIWKFKAKEQYTGDFKEKTRNPILYINGLYDPATPMSAAVNASAGFEGSVVLTHGGYGHGVMFHGSNCTNKVMQEYFMEGTLPEEGTVCEPDVANPWDIPPLVES